MVKKIIKTSDGSKIRDTKTGKLAGSVPKKPKVPTASPIVASKTIESKLSLDVRGRTTVSDSITRASTASLNKKAPNRNITEIRYNTFWRYGDEGDSKPSQMAFILHQHIINIHSPIENKAESFEKSIYGEEAFDNFNRWHEDLHNEELRLLLLNEIKGPSMGNRDAKAHYHGNDLSQDPQVKWILARELIKYPFDHEEMGLASRGSVKDEDTKNLFNTKLQESKAYGLYDAIKVYGVLEPIIIVESGEDEEYPEGYVFDGYHRLVAAVDIDPNMLVPIKDIHSS